MPKTSIIPSLALGLILSGSCSAPTQESSWQSAGVQAAALGGGPFDDAYPGDPAVEARLQLLDVRSRSRGSVPGADFLLRNESDGPLAGSWAVAWATADGTAMAAPLVWTPLSLAPGASYPVTITAPGPDAVSWTLHAVGSDAAPIPE